AADERGLLLAEAEPAALAGLADDGEISCRAEEDDRLLEQLQSPPDRLRRRCQVRELRIPLEERELDGVCRTVPVLGDMDLGKPLLVALVVVVLIPVYEKDDVAILLDRAAFSQVGEDR